MTNPPKRPEVTFGMCGHVKNTFKKLFEFYSNAFKKNNRNRYIDLEKVPS